MEEVTSSKFSSLEIPKDATVDISGDILYVKKWMWDYEECLVFQKKSQEFIRNNRNLKIYIFCNHPHCFTLGRGNERGQSDLIDFDLNLVDQLDYPVHKIHRGGGITFHYPGQWIFYPIVAINSTYTLEDHMCWMLRSVKEVLRDHFGLPKVMAAKKLMGVWNDRKKLASIGVGLNRFVTEHGLALNLIWDEKMFTEVYKTNPCGMSPTNYVSLDKLSPNSSNLLDEFHGKYCSSLKS